MRLKLVIGRGPWAAPVKARFLSGNGSTSEAALEAALVTHASDRNKQLNEESEPTMPAMEVVTSPQYGAEGQTDTLFIGSDGQLYVAWVGPDGGWNGPAGIGAAGLFPPGAALAASPQYGVDNQTDVFAIGSNGQLYVAWVGPDGGWNGPVGISPSPQITLATLRDADGPFVQVDGINFTPGGGVLIAYGITAGGQPTTTTFGEDKASANGGGTFVARIDLQIVDVSAINVKATDLASGRSALGAI
jgi:hypothetical protein